TVAAPRESAAAPVASSPAAEHVAAAAAAVESPSLAAAPAPRSAVSSSADATPISTRDAASEAAGAGAARDLALLALTPRGLAIVWALGALLAIARLSGSLLRRRRLRVGARPLGGEWRQLFEECAARVGLRR